MGTGPGEPCKQLEDFPGMPVHVCQRPDTGPQNKRDWPEPSSVARAVDGS